MNIEVSEKLLPIYSTIKRYIILYGGRGSGKSWAVCDYLLAKALEAPIRILCCREIQNSIKESVYRLLVERIKHHNLENLFVITDKGIECVNGSSFLFKGLFRNENSIKSTEGIDLCFIEEGHSVSRKSLEILIPTIRKPNSKILICYNPTSEDDPVHVDYVLKERDDVLKIEVNYLDNPWFPEVLTADLEYDRKTDVDKYSHIWLGQPLKHSSSQVFYGKWSISEFETDGAYFHYYGADFGHVDPTTLIHTAIKDKTLYIEHEAHKVGIDINNIPVLFNTIPNISNQIITADSSRPDTISYLRQHGFPRIKSSVKTTVDEGISHLRSYEKILIHPRCTHTIDEFRLYSYVVDKLTGNVTNKIEDKYNHCIDSIRYSLLDVQRNIKIKVIPTISGW